MTDLANAASDYLRIRRALGFKLTDSPYPVISKIRTEMELNQEQRVDEPAP